jgi:hypothetical protein
MRFEITSIIICAALGWAFMNQTPAQATGNLIIEQTPAQYNSVDELLKVEAYRNYMQEKIRDHKQYVFNDIDSISDREFTKKVLKINADAERKLYKFRSK